MYYTNISGEKQLINAGLDTAKNHEMEAFYENRTEKEREVHTHLLSTNCQQMPFLWQMCR